MGATMGKNGGTLLDSLPSTQVCNSEDAHITGIIQLNMFINLIHKNLIMNGIGHQAWPNH